MAGAERWLARKWDSRLTALVDPALGVGACGGGCDHVVGHLGEDALEPVGVVLLHGVLGWAAGVAVGHAGAVLEGGVGVGIAGGVERLLQQVDGVVEEVGVAVADGDVESCLRAWGRGWASRAAGWR